MDFIAMHYVWLILGLILVALELFLPGMIIIFFGVGALVTGGVLYLFSGIGFFYQMLLFTVVSLVALLALRRYAPVSGAKVKADKNVNYDDEILGRTAVVVEDLKPGKVGKVELDGTNWEAQSKEALTAGTRVKVISRDGLLLMVEALN